METLQIRVDQIEAKLKEMRALQLEGHRAIVEHRTNINMLTQTLTELRTALKELQRFANQAETNYQHYRESRLRLETQMTDILKDIQLKSREARKRGHEFADRMAKLESEVNSLRKTDAGFELIFDRVWKVVITVVSGVLIYLISSK